MDGILNDTLFGKKYIGYFTGETIQEHFEIDFEHSLVECDCDNNGDDDRMINYLIDTPKHEAKIDILLKADKIVFYGEEVYDICIFSDDIMISGRYIDIGMVILINRLYTERIDEKMELQNLLAEFITYRTKKHYARLELKKTNLNENCIAHIMTMF